MNTKIKWFLFLIVSPALFIQCSKDDNAPPQSIQISASTAELNAINSIRCPLNGQGNGSLFEVTVSYKSISGATVIGGIVESSFDDPHNLQSFVLNESQFEFNWCVRFNDNPYVDFDLFLLDNNGKKSNPSQLRVQRPNGAN